MWKCPECNSYNNSEYCTFCGKKKADRFPEESTIQTEEESVNEATSKISYGNNYRANAPIQGAYNNWENGYAYTEDKAGEPTYNPPMPHTASYKKRSSAPLIILCVLLTVVVLLLAFVLMRTYFVGSVNTSKYEKQKAENTSISSDEGDNADETAPIIDDEQINSILSSLQYTKCGIYVKNLTTGYEYGYNQDDVCLASAMSQVAILDTISVLESRGELDTDSDEMYFVDWDPAGKTAPHSSSQNGQYLSVRSLIEDVATYGDNDKCNLLVDYIGTTAESGNGFDVINSTMRDKKCFSTQINRKIYTRSDLIDYTKTANVTTAKDIAVIYEDLITSGNLGSKSRVIGIFRSIDTKGNKIGLMKYIPYGYKSGVLNGSNTHVTNNVAYISDGKAEIVVAILSETQDGMGSVEDDEKRDKVHGELIKYIMSAQFEG